MYPWWHLWWWLTQSIPTSKPPLISWWIPPASQASGEASTEPPGMASTASHPPPPWPAPVIHKHRYQMVTDTNYYLYSSLNTFYSQHFKSWISVTIQLKRIESKHYSKGYSVWSINHVLRSSCDSVPPLTPDQFSISYVNNLGEITIIFAI